jgi:hypothetical protein
VAGLQAAVRFSQPTGATGLQPGALLHQGVEKQASGCQPSRQVSIRKWWISVQAKAAAISQLKMS